MVQLLEHVGRFDLVFRHGVLAAVGPESDAVTQLVHGVDMIHPPRIHAPQQHDPLHLAHIDVDFLHHLLALRVERPGILLQGRVEAFTVILSHRLLFFDDPVMAAQVLQVVGSFLPLPFRRILCIHPASCREVDHMIRHPQDAVLHVFAHEHAAALSVDDLTLPVHDVVILQHVFPGFEVPPFDALLGALDLLRQQTGCQWFVILQAQPVHHRADPFAAEQAHQVVFQADEELGGTGIALPSAPAAQLVVDPAAFMPLGADNMQAAGLQHAVVLRVCFPLEVFVQLPVPLPDLKHLFADMLAVADSLLDHLVIQVLVLLAQGFPCHEVRVAAQQDIRTAARHVRGDGHRAVMARLGNDLRFLRVILRVQHFVGNPPLGQHAAQHFADLDADRTDQQGLACRVALFDTVQHSPELGVLVLVHHVFQVFADIRPVRRDLHDVQGVDALELGFLRLRRTGHTAQLLVHPEVVLEGNCGQRFAFPLDLHVLLGFDRLVEAFRIPPADHQAAGEFVHDDHLAVLHHVVHVALHDEVRAQGAVHVVVQLAVLRIVDVLDAEGSLNLAGAFVRQGHSLLLLFDLEVRTVPHGTDHRVHLVVELRALFALAGDNQGRTGLVDQDGVDFVHDRKSVSPLHEVSAADYHVVTQVVESQFVVRSVGNVAGIGVPALLGLQVVNDQAYAQAQETVHLAHPFAVTAGQVVVHRHNVDAFAPQRVQVRRHRGYQRLAFTGLHFSDPALVQYDAAQHLDFIGAHAQHAVRSFADGRERFRQDIVFGLAVLQPCAELVGLGPELLIRQLPVLVFQRHHGFYGLLQLLQFRLVAAAQHLLQKFKHNKLLQGFCACPETGAQIQNIISFSSCTMQQEKREAFAPRFFTQWFHVPPGFFVVTPSWQRK